MYQLQKRSHNLGLASRQVQSMARTGDISPVTNHDFILQKQEKEGKLRSLELNILDNKIEGKSWDLLSSEEKKQQRQINYETEVTKTNTFGVKKAIAEISLESAGTRLSLAEEKYHQLDNKLNFERARTIQDKEMMTIQGSKSKLLIDEAKHNLANLQAQLKSRYAVDFSTLGDNILEIPSYKL